MNSAQQTKDIQFISIHTQAEWRQWLVENHFVKQSVWIICNTKNSGRPAVAWSELVDEALCFGWIDSTRKTITKGTFQQLFSRRKPRGTWSKINKEKVEKLIASGKMTEAGLEVIRLAKENGSWSVLNDVEELLIPEDLDRALKSCPGAEAFFAGLSRSAKKMLLQWIALAKRPDTRNRRIVEIAEQAASQMKPKQFR
ncbi:MULTISPECIES: YdeI/OmpD-associated family protein [Sphingobacterium]|uniref:YdeI/OmpD-associated family protein n=1 Tax=Sphingobacterium TaxID=28453 RepID=UPI00257DB464|nr:MULTISPECIES: YdeI/OmpD-associated family protein [Sphingobacterium]